MFYLITNTRRWNSAFDCWLWVGILGEYSCLKYVMGFTLTVFPVKTVNTRENVWNVYCFATNQMRNETAKDNRQTAAWITHDLTRNEELAVSSWQIFMFTVIKCWTSSFSISAYVSANTRYERHFTEKRCWIEQAGSDTARQRVWEQKKMRQPQAMLNCAGYLCLILS